MLVITALFSGHHHHRPSRDQLASAASTTSVVRKLLPLYQQELLLASSTSSIAANQVMNSATYKSAARSIVEIFFFFFFLQIKMHLCSNQKLRIDLAQSYIYICISVLNLNCCKCFFVIFHTQPMQLLMDWSLTQMLFLFASAGEYLWNNK